MQDVMRVRAPYACGWLQFHVIACLWRHVHYYESMISTAEWCRLLACDRLVYFIYCILDKNILCIQAFSVRALTSKAKPILPFCAVNIKTLQQVTCRTSSSIKKNCTKGIQHTSRSVMSKLWSCTNIGRGAQIFKTTNTLCIVYGLFGSICSTVLSFEVFKVFEGSKYTNNGAIIVGSSVLLIDSLFIHPLLSG